MKNPALKVQWAIEGFDGNFCCHSILCILRVIKFETTMEAVIESLINLRKAGLIVELKPIPGQCQEYLKA
jgi:hypothetical protein